MAMPLSLGKTVNLLRVEVPPVETQILLKVRFCNVDRGASTDLGVSFASGAFNQSTAISTGQFSSPGDRHQWTGQPVRRAQRSAIPERHQPRSVHQGAGRASACWKRWPSQICWRSTAKQASFVSGGEFPVPMIQTGAGSATQSAFPSASSVSASTSCPASRRAEPSSSRLRRKSARSITRTQSPSPGTRFPRCPPGG